VKLDPLLTHAILSAIEVSFIIKRPSWVL